MEKLDKEKQYEISRAQTEKKAARIAEIANALAIGREEDAKWTGIDVLHEDALAKDEKREYALRNKIGSLDFLMDVYSKCQNNRNYLKSEHGKGELTQFSDVQAVYNSIFENCPELKTDKALIRKMIEIKGPWSFLKDIDSSVLENENFLLDLIKMNKDTLDNLPDQKRKNFQFIKKAIEANPKIGLRDLRFVLNPTDYKLLERTLGERTLGA